MANYNSADKYNVNSLGNGYYNGGSSLNATSWTGKEDGYSYGVYTVSGAFKGESEIKSLYLNDYANTKSNKWYFNSDAYGSAIEGVNSMVKSLSSSSEEVIGITVELNSPEGQKLQGDLTSCFSNLGACANGIASSIQYCGAWAETRAIDGLASEKASLETVTNLPTLNHYNGIYAGNIKFSEEEKAEIVYKSKKSEAYEKEGDWGDIKFTYLRPIGNVLGNFADGFFGTVYDWVYDGGYTMEAFIKPWFIYYNTNPETGEKYVMEGEERKAYLESCYEEMVTGTAKNPWTDGSVHSTLAGSDYEVYGEGEELVNNYAQGTGSMTWNALIGYLANGNMKIPTTVTTYTNTLSEQCAIGLEEKRNGQTNRSYQEIYGDAVLWAAGAASVTFATQAVAEELTGPNASKAQQFVSGLADGEIQSGFGAVSKGEDPIQAMVTGLPENALNSWRDSYYPSPGEGQLQQDIRIGETTRV